MAGRKKNGKALTPEERKARMDAVAAKLEAGVEGVMDSDEFRRYLSFMVRFHSYSANNVMLILLQRPDATMVTGYGAWRKMGRQVRKGETGIVILAPKKWSRTVEDEKTGEKTRVSGLAGFTTVSVFDVSQTDGEEIPARPGLLEISGETDEGAMVLGATRFVCSAAGVEVSYDRDDELGAAKGAYFLREEKIALRSDLSTDQRAKTLVHEYVHHVLHHRGAADRETAEVEAEGTAYVVLEHFGLDTGDYSFGYIAGWSGHPKAVTAALSTIQKTAGEVIGLIEARIETGMGAAA